MRLCWFGASLVSEKEELNEKILERSSVFLLCAFSATAVECNSMRAQTKGPEEVVRLDPAIEGILAADTKLELLQGEGSFEGGEGPVWVQRRESRYLLFSDTSGDPIFEWTRSCLKCPCPADGKLSVFLEYSGYKDATRVGSKDANGARLYGSPDGLAFSPDEKILYVNNGGPMPKQKQIFAYDVQSNDTVTNRRLFIDFTGERGLGGPDGMKVDRQGNVYSTGAGGVWIVSPDGKRLGQVPAPDGGRFSNLAFGDADSKSLYVVTSKSLWRIRVNVPGIRPQARVPKDRFGKVIFQFSTQ